MKKLLIILFAISTSVAYAQELYRMPEGVRSGVSSFENPNSKKGSGGQRNKGAKGNAFESLKAGESKTLLQVNITTLHLPTQMFIITHLHFPLYSSS